MNKIIKMGAIFTLIFLAACAHKIQVTPELTALRNIDVGPATDKVVGYYISPEDRAAVITTPGGGGDKVTYSSYKDTESALNTILLKNFSRVYSVDSLSNSGFINDKKIELIFLPKITTNSSSNSLVTWPPTSFTVELICKAINADGDEVWSKAVESEGNATFSEFKSDFGLAGRRAMNGAFEKMLVEISNASELK